MRGGRRMAFALLVSTVQLSAALLGSGTASAWPGAAAGCPIGLAAP